MAIVEVVELQLSLIDHLEADIESKLKSAGVLRQSILRHAFTGQLVSQDLNDEPAKEMLKRISAERNDRALLAASLKQIGKKSKPSRAASSGTARKRAASRK
jgi:type I restriction enzyme S subunit